MSAEVAVTNPRGGKAHRQHSDYYEDSACGRWLGGSAPRVDPATLNPDQKCQRCWPKPLQGDKVASKGLTADALIDLINANWFKEEIVNAVTPHGAYELVFTGAIENDDGKPALKLQPLKKKADTDTMTNRKHEDELILDTVSLDDNQIKTVPGNTYNIESNSTYSVRFTGTGKETTIELVLEVPATVDIEEFNLLMIRFIIDALKAIQPLR